MQARKLGNEYRTTVVCVDGYERRCLSGRLYNPFRSAGTKFASLMEFLRAMETLLDEMQVPQAFSERRTFLCEDGALPNRMKQNRGERGKMATFEVRLLFRQNASWQGEIRWLEGGQDESFRSALELVLLMDSALSQNKERGNE